jgi:hypothetical protein
VFIRGGDPPAPPAVVLDGEIDGLRSFEAAIRWRRQR